MLRVMLCDHLGAESSFGNRKYCVVIGESEGKAWPTSSRMRKLIKATVFYPPGNMNFLYENLNHPTDMWDTSSVVAGLRESCSAIPGRPLYLEALEAFTCGEERRKGRTEKVRTWRQPERVKKKDMRGKGRHEGCWVKHVQIRAVQQALKT